MRVLILGAGGHGKVIADILQMQEAEVVGFLDDDSSTWDTRPLGLPVMGGIDCCREVEFDRLILGIGSNEIRQQVAERIGAWADDRWINAIHPTAVVSASARFGHGIVMMAHTVVSVDVKIGNHVIINTGATVDYDCTVGDYAHVAPGANLADGTQVGIGAFLGTGCRTVPRSVVGEWAVVGAGATVIDDIPPKVVAKGTPARW